MYPLAPQHERKTRKDYGTKRGRHSTFASSSPTFDRPSSSNHIDDDNDEDDEGMDIAKLLRKRLKPDKHGHRNGIECARDGRMLSKSITSSLTLIGQFLKGNDSEASEETYGKRKFALKRMEKKHKCL
ncbi:hypothetical protein Tco_0237275 [Tanacetum coccineum]